MEKRENTFQWHRCPISPMVTLIIVEGSHILQNVILNLTHVIWFPSVTQEAKWEKEKESERVRMGLESKDSFEEPFGDINMLNIDSEGFPVS